MNDLTRQLVIGCTLWLALGCDAIIGEAPADEEVVAPPEEPPADALEATLRERGREVAPYMIREGDPMRGEGQSGSSQDFSQILYPGWCYKVIGLGTETVEDLDLRVYSPENILLQRDTTRDRQPYVGQMRPICPSESGTYRIEVRLVTGSGPFIAQLYRSI